MRSSTTGTVGSQDWDAMVRRYNGAIVTRLVARGMRPARARELAQDTWVRLYANWQAGKLPHIKMPGLAYAQADFVLADERRRRSETLLDDGIVRLEDAAGPNVENRAIARSTLRRVQRVLDSGGERPRRIFEMYYNEGRKTDEIGALLGITGQRVRSSLTETRKRLAVALGEDA